MKLALSSVLNAMYYSHLVESKIGVSVKLFVLVRVTFEISTTCDIFLHN